MKEFVFILGESRLMKKIFLMRNEGILSLQEIRKNTKTKSKKYDKFYELIWDEFIHNLSISIKNFLLDVEIEMHPLNIIQKHKLRMINPTDRIITMDAYNQSSEVIQLGVSRIFDCNGINQLKIGSRPGYDYLDKQLKTIKDKYGEGPFTLDEDDTYTGGTINEIVDLATKLNLKINEVIVGNQVGENTKVKLKAVNCYTSKEVVDINDPRDFLFGSYEGGLVIEYGKYKKARVPYVLPFSSPYLRTSIPLETEETFSQQIAQLNINFYRNLENEFHKPVFISYGNKYFSNYIYWKYRIKTESTTFIEFIEKIYNL